MSLYFYLKISHILSAAFLVTSLSYSFVIWKRFKSNDRSYQDIQLLTMRFIIPLIVIQLITGFTIISIQHEKINQLWIKTSIAGLVVVIVTWFMFLYSLLLGQEKTKKGLLIFSNRKTQALLLSFCASSILVMIFCMANKVV